MLWVLLGIAVLIGLLMLASYAAYFICFYSPKEREFDPFDRSFRGQYEQYKDQIIASSRFMADTPFEEVCIRSFDGFRLAGKYYHTDSGAPLMILFHGYRSMAYRDCSGGYALAKKMGFNVLAIDQRGHGSSGGRTITFGVLERKDCLAWINYATSRFSESAPIVLWGLSMGAATVLMASGMELPSNVSAVIADCGYATPCDIIKKVCMDMHCPAKLVYPFVRLGAKIYGGFDLEETSALESVANTNLPILIIHGEDDRLVPYEMSRTIYSACASPARLFTVAGAGHGLSYMVDPVGYEQAVVSFLGEVSLLKEHIQNNAFCQNILDTIKS